MYKLISLVLFLLLASQTYSQGKKEIKKNKIASIKVMETVNGKTIDDGKTVYDVNGELLEKIDYLKDGSQKKAMKYKLNNLGNVVEEFEYDEKNNLKEQSVIKYNANGTKKEELIYDDAKKLIKKHTYQYDVRGLKTDRKTFDATGILISTKKYTYTYN